MTLVFTCSCSHSWHPISDMAKLFASHNVRITIITIHHPCKRPQILPDKSLPQLPTWVRLFGDSVKKEAIGKAVREIMVGEEAEERRSRARKLGKQARRAVEEGGSSYLDLRKLIQELKARQLG